MPTIIFRAAFLRYADLRMEDEAGKFCRLHMTADWTDVVRQHMGWEEVPDCVPKATLSGTITAHNMVLTPNGRELARHELQLNISEVSDFTLVRQKDEEGEPKGEELRFIVRTTQGGAMALVENYVERIGRGAARLKISHEKQEGLFDSQAAEQSEEQEEDKPEEKEPALASKAEVERAEDPKRAFQRQQLDKVRQRASERKLEPVQ